MVLAGCGSSDDAPASSAAAPTVVDTTTPPGSVTWQRFQGVPVPVTDAGPADPYSAAATGYAHTPQGAAVAAINSTARMSVATDSQWPQVLSAGVAPGPGRDTWTVSRAQLSITGSVPASDAPTPLGYVVDEYTPAAADLTLVIEQSDRSITAQSTRMVYTGGDWRLDLSAPSSVTALDSAPASMVALPQSQ